MESIYRYGKDYYTIEELAEIIRSHSSDDQKFVEDIIAHNILSDIMTRGNKPIVGKKLRKLADTEYVQQEHILVGLKKHFVNRKRIRRLHRASGLFANRYKQVSLHNGESFLLHLLSGTLGYNYPTYEDGSVRFVAVDLLSDEECVALARNYKKMLRDKKVVPMNGGKKK